MQGFPTLYGFQVYYPEMIQKHFKVTREFTQYLGDYDRPTYLKDLKKILLGDGEVENTILLEIKPHEQKTRIDFYCTEDYFGIQPVCITELIAEGNQLYYITCEEERKNKGKKNL